MPWCRKSKRFRIYARDNHECTYCVSGKPLTLDHIKPRSKGGSNRARNLITCCWRCNRQRSDVSSRSYAIRVARETGQDWRKIMRRIDNRKRRKLPCLTPDSK